MPDIVDILRRAATPLKAREISDELAKRGVSLSEREVRAEIGRLQDDYPIAALPGRDGGFYYNPPRRIILSQIKVIDEMELALARKKIRLKAMLQGVLF